MILAFNENRGNIILPESFVKRQIVIIILINHEKPFISVNSLSLLWRRTFKCLNRDVFLIER